MTQWCVEEAAWERYEFEKPSPGLETIEAAQIGPPVDPRLAEAQAAMREFARGAR